MRILTVFPGFDVGGGMQTVVKTFSDKQSENNIDTDFIGTYHQDNFFKALFRFIYGLLKAINIFVLKKCDLVHVHTASKGSFYRKSVYCLVARLFRIPVVLHMHGGGFKEFYSNNNSLTKRYIDFILCNTVDTLIVLSNSWYKWFETNFDLRNSPVILKNSVDITIDTTISKRNQDDLKCIYVGRLVKDKGIDDLLKSIATPLLSEKIHVDLVGDGELEHYKEIVVKHNLQEMTTFWGWLSREESIQKIYEADVLLLPSYKEGLPMVILEAMACKTAVLTTNVGGIPDVISHGINGLMFTPGDVAAITSNLEQFCNDEVLLKTIVENAYNDYLNEYRLDVIFPQLLEVYTTVLNNK